MLFFSLVHVLPEFKTITRDNIIASAVYRQVGSIIRSKSNLSLPVVISGPVSCLKL